MKIYSDGVLFMDYGKILFITDIDGTLTHGGRLSAENERAVKNFQSRGGLFTVATGRFLSYIKESFGNRLIPNAPIAAVNGSVIYGCQAHDILWKRPFPPNVREVIDFIQGTAKTSLIRLCGEKSCFGATPGCCIGGDEVLKLVTVTESESDALFLMNALNERFAETCSTARSWATGVETMSREAGKGKCAEYIKQITGAEICIAMGDFENDCGMLRAADIGIAVGNAPDNVKECAALVTVSNSENAVAYVLGHIEEICGEYAKQAR